MKKKLLLLCFIILFLNGCSKKKEELIIEGFIEEKQNAIIGIHYPQIGIKTLDQQIEQYVFDIKQEFESQISTSLSLNSSELNIDYEYWKVGNRYHNITLTTFINSNTLAHPMHEIKTFVYDSNTNQFLTLDDIISINLVNIKTELLKKHKDCILIDALENTVTDFNKKQIKFTFTEQSITLYFDPYEIATGACGFIKYEIVSPTFKIEIPTQEKIENTFEYHPSKKKLSITKPTIALTFDDGPSQYTKEIVELLNKYNANATFFILGNKINNYQETLKFLLQNGNELGNHSYNHKQLTKLSEQELKQQIESTNKIVKETLNYDIHLLRPTYGAITNQLKNNIDMEIVLWNVDTKDWKLRNSKMIAKKALGDIKDGKIVLMHDIYKTTLQALKLILPELEKQGYQIVTVSELKEIQKLRNEKQNR